MPSPAGVVQGHQWDAGCDRCGNPGGSRERSRMCPEDCADVKDIVSRSSSSNYNIIIVFIFDLDLDKKKQ